MTIFDRTPTARYQRDTTFRQLVDMMEAHLHAAKFTPSELREASLLSAIHYEQRTIRHAAGYTMSDYRVKEAWARVEELFRAIQTDDNQ